MANELAFSINNLGFRKGGASFTVPTQSASITVSGSNAIQKVQNIGTADETLDLGDVATNGYLFLKNMDATNYITFGADGSSYPIKLKAAEVGIFRWNGAAIHAKANSSACNLQYLLIED